MRERAGRLMFLPEPRDFDQDAPKPAVAGLGSSLAPCHRSAVVGARGPTKIRSQLPSPSDGSGEHLASKNCRACATHSLQSDEHLSLSFDHRVLRVGRIAFLLDLTKLGLDQVVACIFPLEFAAQPIWQWMAFRGLEGGKIDPGPAQLRVDATDSLSKQQAFDPIDMPCAFADKALTFPMRPARVFFLDRRYAHDGADVAFSAIDRDQGAQKRQDVDPVSLDAAGPAVDLDAGGIEDTALDTNLGQCSGQPEAVVSSLVADQDPAVFPSGSAEPGDQFPEIAASDPMNARTIAVGKSDTEYPGLLSQFDCRVDCLLPSDALLLDGHCRCSSRLIRAATVPRARSA